MGAAVPCSLEGGRSREALPSPTPQGFSDCLFPSFCCEKEKGPHSSRKSWKPERETVPSALPSVVTPAYNWLWRTYGSGEAPARRDNASQLNS